MRRSRKSRAVPGCGARCPTQRRLAYARERALRQRTSATGIRSPAGAGTIGAGRAASPRRKMRRPSSPEMRSCGEADGRAEIAQWLHRASWAYGIDGPGRAHYYVDGRPASYNPNSDTSIRRPHACSSRRPNDDLAPTRRIRTSGCVRAPCSNTLRHRLTFEPARRGEACRAAGRRAGR